MRNSRILIALVMLAVLALAACSEQSTDPLSTTAPNSVDKKGIGNINVIDPAFLEAVAQAFEVTPFERVEMIENPDKSEGGLIGYPDCFDPDNSIQLIPPVGKSLVLEGDPIYAYLPSEQTSTPDGCILMMFDGMPVDVEFVVKTFLPAWVDEGADLGDNHATYELVVDVNGDYTARDLTNHLTPDWPWMTPPVDFNILPPSPGAPNRRLWVADKNGPGVY